MELYQIRSVEELARRLGYPRGERIQKFLRVEGARPGFETLEDIARVFADFDIHWLLTGEGHPRKAAGNPSRADPQLRSPEGSPDINKSTGSGRFDLHSQAAEPAERYVQVPVVSNREGEPRIVMLDTRAAAGFPGHVGDAEFLRDQPLMHLPGHRYSGGGLIALQVSGDSMAPTIRHGDWLVARPLVSPLEEMVEGYVHLLVTRDGCVAKRLFKGPKGRQTLVCRSDNPAYPSYEVAPEAGDQVYMALAILSEDLSNRANDVELRITRLERDLMAVQAALKKG